MKNLIITNNVFRGDDLLCKIIREKENDGLITSLLERNINKHLIRARFSDNSEYEVITIRSENENFLDELKGKRFKRIYFDQGCSYRIYKKIVSFFPDVNNICYFNEEDQPVNDYLIYTEIVVPIEVKNATGRKKAENIALNIIQDKCKNFPCGTQVKIVDVLSKN